MSARVAWQHRCTIGHPHPEKSRLVGVDWRSTVKKKRGPVCVVCLCRVGEAPAQLDCWVEGHELAGPAHWTCSVEYLLHAVSVSKGGQPSAQPTERSEAWG